MKMICKRWGAAALALCMALALCVSLSGCGEDKATSADKTKKSDYVEEAKTVVTNAFDALQEGDLEKAQEYIPDLEPEVLEEDEAGSNRLTVALLNLALHNMEYKIKDAKQKPAEDGEEADPDDVLVTVEVTNLDMEAVVKEFYGEMVDALIADQNSQGNLSRKKMDQMLNEIADQMKKDKKLKTATTDIEVEAGVIDLEDEQLDVMLGGLLTADANMDE